MLKGRLAQRLVVAFILLALGSAYLTTFISNHFIDRHFDQFLLEQRADRQKGVVRALEQAIADDGLTEDVLRDLSGAALVDHLYMRVFDLSGRLIWQAEPRFGHGMMGWGRHRPPVGGAVVEAAYPLVIGGSEVGSVAFGFQSEPYLSPAHEAYQRGIWRAGLFSAGLVALGAAAIGWWSARRLSSPLQSLTDAVKAMQVGEALDVPRYHHDDEISELSEAFQSLRLSLQQQEMGRQQLTADIAHELRTPLAALQAQIEAIQDGVHELTPERLAACHREVLRLSHLVRDVENLARLEAAEQKLVLEECDLAEITEEAAEGFRGVAEKAGVALRCEAEPLLVKADRARLTQVLVNLLSNATKYTPRGGSVLVVVTGDGKDAVVTVSDTGTGIPAEDLTRIFDRFYRGEKSRSRRTGGAGLGLAIAKAIVERHDGSISVDNDPHLGGARFAVRLPKS